MEDDYREYLEDTLIDSYGAELFHMKQDVIEEEFETKVGDLRVVKERFGVK